MLFTLAWRNLWRNRRRSAIVLSSVVLGYAALVFLDALSTGMIHQMVRNRIGVHTAHIQIHRAGFRVVEVPVHHFQRAHGKSQFFNVRRIARVAWQLTGLWIRLVTLRRNG